MRRSLAKFSVSEASNHTPFSADFTTTTPELKFSVHSRLHGRVRLTNHDRWFLIQLYRWFPSILQLLTIVDLATTQNEGVIKAGKPVAVSSSNTSLTR